MAPWSQAFHQFRPDLWEASDGISLEYKALTQFTQHLANSSLVPDLDPPPIYCGDARYLAQVQAHYTLMASGLLTKLEAAPWPVALG